jgi:PAS domain S-box-containing protein
MLQGGKPVTEPISVLIVEDMPDDAELMILRLSEEGFLMDWQRVDNEPDYLAALTATPDLILADWSLPQFSGLRALQLLQERSLDIPFIIVSGSIGEEIAVDAIHKGAYDYVLKGRLGRLGQAVRHALEDKRLRDERKWAEEELRESEDRYRDLVEHSHDLLCTHDLEGKLLSVNPAALRISGYSKDELLGINFRDFLAPEVRGQFGNYLTEIQAKGAASGVMLVQTKGGEKRLWEYHNTLRTEGVAAPIVRGMARDITERKRAEEALRKSEERFRELYDNAPVGYFEYDHQGRITNVNRTELEMLGYTLDEMIGQPVWKFIVEEETTRQQILAKLAGTMPSARGFERNYKKKDGTVLPVSIEDRILRDPQGRITGIRCTIQDITDRKKAEEAIRSSEEKYRTILENIEDGYYEVDIAGNFTFFNDSMCQIYGYSREELMGMNDRQYTDQENAKKLFQTFNKVYRTGEPSREFDWEIIRKDGTKRSIEASVSLIKDSSGQTIGFRGIVRDITERKRSEEEKASLQDQLRQSQKIEAIGRLAGGIAHDFNNLLTVIRGYSQLSLHELKEDVPLRGNIEEIKRAAERAAELTQQLLAFSRRQILETKVLDLNAILRDLDKMLHRLIGEDIELVTVLADDLGRVKTDPGWVEQIIMNLAVNARDAMPSVGKLTIETANVELDEAYALNHIAVTPGRYVMLSMSDTGVGMLPEIREKVFEPFFTTKEKGKGTGLGLSTVYGIVKQSGGNIWIYSEPGKGTTFKIYLPRVDDPLEEIIERVVKEELLLGSETILIVEDQEDVLKLAARILSKHGYTVIQTSSTSKALEICREQKKPIHLILTDVVMPQMSGRELIEQCRQMRADFKTLYMSGYTDNAITHHGILEPGIHFVQKPFTVDGLARKVREALDE